MKLEVIGLSLIIIIGAIGLGYMHEEVHVAIYRGYGIESHVEYFSHFPNMVTIAKEPCPTEECELAHNINEIVGYPLQVLYTVFSLLLLFRIIQEQTKIEMKLYD